MKVLIACEFSGEVRDAFLALGHEAISCDLLPTDKPGPHIQDDVLNHLDKQWDLLIAHPPCTYLANSGVRWLYTTGRVKNETRWLEMEKGANFFKALLNAPIPRIAVENPIMHRHAQAIIGQPATQVIQPWQHGHGETKATCLWLKGLNPLKPSNVIPTKFNKGTTCPPGRNQAVHYMPPGKDRWKERSRTLPGVAAAIAHQWSGGQAHV